METPLFEELLRSKSFLNWSPKPKTKPQAITKGATPDRSDTGNKKATPSKGKLVIETK